MKNLLLFPFRIVRELVGYNLCFFGCHAWREQERIRWDSFGRYDYTERYTVCKRFGCNTIKPGSIERIHE